MHSAMPQVEEFSDPQKRRLISSASHIDKLLIDIEQILLASNFAGFPKYKNPLAPMQMKVVRDYIARLRQQTLHVFKELNVPIPEARFDSAFSIQVTLQFVEVALEEIAPERLTGYGPVPESLVKPLRGGIQEMKGIVRQIASYLSQRADSDLSTRLVQLPESDGELLREVGNIIDRRGLVEFRASLSQLVEKIENSTYEIAFFGRVSAGKSSLLNRIIGVDLLPTGVTPITAVPTRIKNGAVSELLVRTVDGKSAHYGIDRLADFATEPRNPSNAKHVTRLLLSTPLPILPQEVVLVDTPGLGSLALEGATETLAYLPRCDLGIVLVDASSSLHPEDVATVDALRAASVPVLVVLSKVDLLNKKDRGPLLDYTRRQLEHQLGADINVAPLSARPELSQLLEGWIANEIAPRASDARRLLQDSIHRKTRALAQRVFGALEISAKMTAIPSVEGSNAEQVAAEAQLRAAASSIEVTYTKSLDQTDLIRDAAQVTIRRLAESATAFWGKESQSSQLDHTWIAKNVNQWTQREVERVAYLVQGLANQMTGALNKAARVLSTGEREDRFDLQSFVKEMPVADYTPAVIQLRRPIVFSISEVWARRFVEHQLERYLGAVLVEFFNSYGRAVEAWARATLNTLAREFAMHADVYRAQLQRLTSAPDPQESRPVDSIFQDLAFLKEKLELQEADQPVESTA
jgi:small GTP-binding protein